MLANSFDVKDVVMNKHDGWKSENEYRLYSNQFRSEDLGAAISSITFGLNTSKDAERYIICIVGRFYGINAVRLYKMDIKDGFFVRRPLEANEAMPSSSQTLTSILP